MKMFKTILAGVCLLSLTACMNSRDWIGGGGEYLTDNEGLVADCRGNFLSMESPPTQAEQFWQANNLPKGTTDFVCKEGKAYEASKVTDCQGNLIAKQSGGVEGFRAKYNLNNGNIRFTCNNGTVTPVPLSGDLLS